MEQRALCCAGGKRGANQKWTKTSHFRDRERLRERKNVRGFMTDPVEVRTVREEELFCAAN